MTVVMSMWRNDVHRGLLARVRHLLAKTSTNGVRWLWVIGASSDETEAMLRQYESDSVTIVRHDTGLVGEDTPTRRLRGSQTASAMFRHVLKSDSRACLHESDLQSPSDVLELLAKTSLPVAAWPVIQFPDQAPQFYDIWAFRDLSGVSFSAGMRRPVSPFQVGSFGSCWLAPAVLVRNRVIGSECVVDLCSQWRREGHQLTVDPRVTVTQPVDLWVAA